MPAVGTRTDQAFVRRYAVFIKSIRNNRDPMGTATTCWIRRPYNIVEYDWNDGAPRRSYIEPTGGRHRSMAETEEIYDGIKQFDNPPDWDKFGANTL